MKTTVPSDTKNGPDGRAGGRLRGELPAGSLRLLETSLKKQWKRYRRQLHSCQEKFTEEAIHDARVEARRLLSTVELLGGFLPAGRVRKVERGLKRHLDTFEDLRDTQVQLPLIEKMQGTFPAARPFYAYLRKREERLVKATRKGIKKVKTQQLGKLIGACREEVGARRQKCAPAKALALLLRSVDRAFARTSQLRARIDPRDTRTIHRTRVAFKKFRYMAETLMEYLPAPDPELLEAMRHYQTMMGDIQDAEVLQQAVEKFLHKHAPAPDPARQLREELSRRRQRLIDLYLGARAQMREFWPWDGLPPAARAARRKGTSRSQ